MKNVVEEGGAHAPQVLRKSILLVLLVSAAILMIPAIAMQFTSEFKWGPGDFVVAAIMLVAPRVHPLVPGSIVAIVVVTVVSALAGAPVPTIGALPAARIASRARSTTTGCRSSTSRMLR